MGTKDCKRVGMLGHHYYPDVRVSRLAEGLAEEGFEVHVICNRRPVRPDGTRQPIKETINNVHIYRAPLSRKRGSVFRYLFEYAFVMFYGMWKLTALHLKKKLDVVHIHNMPDILVIAGLLTKWSGATLLLDVHDPMSELFQANYHVDESNLLIRVIKLQERLCYKLPDHLITVSQPMAENLAEKSGREVESIKVIHNFSDLSKFPVFKGSGKWPRNKNNFVVLYAGTVTEHYGLDIALRAIAAVTEDIPNIQFRILGHGNRLDDILRLADELGIGDRVEHIAQVPIDQVKNIMIKADIGISTHHGGAFGKLYFSNKIIDYMTQMVPVLSSHTYTIEKLIPEDAIFYFEPGSAEDLAKQIKNMYNNPDLVQDKINNAKKLIGRYNWQAEKKNLISFYNELLK